MQLFATKDLFPVLLKLGTKYKQMLGGFNEFIDDDLAIAVNEYSKIHYLDDLSEFLPSFKRVIDLIKTKKRDQVELIIEFLAEKLRLYISHHKNEDISEIIKFYEENKAIFSKISVEYLEEFIKKDSILGLITTEETKLINSVKNPEKNNFPSNQILDEIPKLSIKVASKPYEDEEIPENYPQKVSFFDKFDFKNHHQYPKDQNFHSRPKKEPYENLNLIEKPKKKYKKIKEEGGTKQNTEKKIFLDGEEHKNEGKMTEQEIRLSIRNSILAQEPIFLKENLINAGSLSQELRKTSGNPDFCSLLFTESLALQNEISNPSKLDFWKSILKVLKHLLDGDQIEKLKESLKLSESKVSEFKTNRRGRYK